jgi:hypothetical protein
MSFDTAVLLKLILDGAHFALLPWGTLIAVTTLFPTVTWLKIPINFRTWVSTAILLYVLKLL